MEADLKPEVRLTAYCGRFCGKCAMCSFGVGLGLAVLQKVNEAIAVCRSAEAIGMPPIRDMAVHCCAAFDNDLNTFVGLTGKAFSPGCRAGCVPPCEIAACCRAKEHLTCAACDQMAECSKLDRYRDVVAGNLSAIREIGLERWAQEQYDETVAEKKASILAAVEAALASSAQADS